MGTEIERKFLVVGDPTPAAFEHVRIVQGYLCQEGETSVRVRISGERAQLGVKRRLSLTERLEYEFDIGLDEAQSMIEEICEGRRVEKTRHLLRHAGKLWEVDVFGGMNAGLVVAEVELESADEEVDLPDWAGEEVSGDFRYLNVVLAETPYSEW